MDEFPGVLFGMEYTDEGLTYYSVLSETEARKFERFLLARDCEVKNVFILATEQELRAFIGMEKAYRDNVWSKLPREQPPREQLH